MMFRESVDTHQLLLAALIVFAQDLSSSGGAQAWTYNYSIYPSRRWFEASQWCQQHFTGMVVIQNQEETDFLNNLLPLNAKYYWIGIHKENGEWIRARTNEKVPAEAQNWAPEEPDAIVGQDCVEIYIKRREDTAKWNNENCRKKKGTVCYTASCTRDSCSVHANCVETIGNYTCQCHPGFFGSRCEEAIACKPLLDPEQGYQNCSNPYGLSRFNSSCLFQCGLGFQLLGTPQLLCQASGHWSHPVPLCKAEQCPVLNHTNVSAGNMTCSHPIAPYSYNSSCKVRCDEGYELSGQDQIQCDSTGQWTASVPACTVKKCSPVVFPVTGNMTCVDSLEPFSFGSQCKFTCHEGYYLTGDTTLTCLASGQWSNPTPTCTVIQCNQLKAPLNASIQCHGPLGVYSYGSICTVQCGLGFDLIGTNMTKCSSQGNWTHSLPVCHVKRCNPINPPHGSLSCSDPNGSFSFGSRCTTTCNEGFLLNGTASTECNSLGMWSKDIPLCLAKRCPILNPPSHGSLACSDPHGEFSFGSQCNITCNTGFVLNGTADTGCTALGIWSADIPHCLVKRCPTLHPPSHGSLVCSDPHEKFSFGSKCNMTCAEGFVLNGTTSTECNSLGVWSANITRCSAKRCPTLNPPAHGSFVCSAPHGELSFGAQCKSACDDGFVLNGTAETECTSQGRWSTDIPRCIAKRCPILNSPSHGSLVCADPHEKFSFGSQCNITCVEGFVLNGTTTTECNALGMWSVNIPHCLAKRCPTLNSPAHGSLVCSGQHGEFSFGYQCTFTCDEGFVLNGTADTECTSVGMWSTEIPRCLALQCPLLAKPPQHGQMNCSHIYSPFSYGSHCDFECNEGFWMRGKSAMECNSSGHWTQDLPTCHSVQCEAIQSMSSHLSVNCSHPLANFSLGSQCIFTCKEGYSLHGTEKMLCLSTGLWSNTLPQCTVEGMSVGTAMLMYTGIGAGSVAVPLALIGLCLLALTRFRKRGNAIVSEASGWGDRENPAFEF